MKKWIIENRHFILGMAIGWIFIEAIKHPMSWIGIIFLVIYSILEIIARGREIEE